MRRPCVRRSRRRSRLYGRCFATGSSGSGFGGKPIGRFIADFAAVGARLVVEVDGGYHASRRAADARRDRELARLGCRVLRLEAALVLEHPLVALARVRAVLALRR